MNPRLNVNLRQLSLCSALFVGTALADEVRIVSAELRNVGGDQWSVNVTLQHADSGWDHYADEWRVLDANGKVLGNRVLYHPHVHEQPFTRGLSAIALPAAAVISIEAHDTQHGWSPTRLRVNLGDAVGGRLTQNAH